MNLYKFDMNGNLAKEDYISMHLEIASILRKDLNEGMK